MLCLVLRNLSTVMPRIFYRSSPIQKSATVLMPIRDYLFQKLGDEFTRTQLLEEAVAMGIKENTALTWLKRLTKHGKLISMDGKGLYTRACVYE